MIPVLIDGAASVPPCWLHRTRRQAAGERNICSRIRFRYGQPILICLSRSDPGAGAASSLDPHTAKGTQRRHARVSEGLPPRGGRTERRPIRVNPAYLRGDAGVG